MYGFYIVGMVKGSVGHTSERGKPLLQQKKWPKIWGSKMSVIERFHG